MIRTIPTSAICLAAALGLAACGNGAGDSAPEPAPDASGETQSANGSEAIAVSETGWLTVGADGAVQTTFFDPDGGYRDYRNGELTFEGRWEQRPDGTLCFEPESGLGQCWETDASASDGTVTATNTDGTSIEIKRITYSAPPESDGAGEDEG